MTQRKHKSGKPGNHSGKASQSADRQRKSSFSRASSMGPDKQPDKHWGNLADDGGVRGSGGANKHPWRYPLQSEKDIKSHQGKGGPAGRQMRQSPPADSRRREGSDKAIFPKYRSDHKSDGPYWLFGQHAVSEAIGNPRRKIHRLLHVVGVELHLRDTALADRTLPPWEPIERSSLEQLLPQGAVHQGIAAWVAPLPDLDLLDICDQVGNQERATVVILDQVTDPHNVGAILRSAAAFGAIAVILTERHAAPESGTLAKSASGALEHVPLVRVGNLARAMEQLKEAGFWLAGLAAEGQITLAAAKLSGKVGLVMGAEGSGLRRLTRDHCDLLVRLPTSGSINHINVSNAAAVALYELARQHD